ERSFERLLERGALAHTPREVAGRDLGVVLGLEFDPLAAQPLPQAVVIRERTVVNQAEIEPGRERVRAFGGHAALGGHPRVAEAVAPFDVTEPELLHKRPWTADLLVDLERPACAHDRHVLALASDPVLRLLLLALHHEHGRVRPDPALLP